MITLHIYLQVMPNHAAEFERIYREVYVPAISTQRGFQHTALLRTYAPDRSATIEGRQDWEYEIDIMFETEEHRRTWAAGPEHAQVWPLVEAMCGRITWQGFDFLA